MCQCYLPSLMIPDVLWENSKKIMIANIILPFSLYWQQCARLKPWARKLHLYFSLSWLCDYFVFTWLCFGNFLLFPFWLHTPYLPTPSPHCNCNDHWPFQVARQKKQRKKFNYVKYFAKILNNTNKMHKLQV